MHTTETDGRATLEEMAEAARALGYEYIAITDHSKALAMANGLDEKRAVAFAHQVRDLNRGGLRLRIFSGLECDIRRDGAMDLADDALAELDFVIGSVHSHMNLEAAEMTDRLLRALECPSCACWAIPPAACCCIAIRSRSISNASPPKPRAATCIWKSTPARSAWIWAAPWSAPPRARAQVRHLHRRASPQASRVNMPYGVLMARRGWLEARDILNTLPLAEFAKTIHKS